MQSGEQNISAEDIDKLFDQASQTTTILRDKIIKLKNQSKADQVGDEERYALAIALISLSQLYSQNAKTTLVSIPKKTTEDTTSYLLPALTPHSLIPLIVAEPVYPPTDEAYREVLEKFPTNIDPLCHTNKLLNKMLNKVICSTSDHLFQEQFDASFDAAITRISRTSNGDELRKTLDRLKTETWETYTKGKLSKEMTLSTAMSANKFTSVITEFINDQESLKRARKAIDEFRSETHHLKKISKELAVLCSTAAFCGVGFLLAGPAGAVVGGIIGWSWGLWYVDHKKEIKETANKADEFLTERTSHLHRRSIEPHSMKAPKKSKKR